MYQGLYTYPGVLLLKIESRIRRCRAPAFGGHFVFFQKFQGQLIRVFCEIQSRCIGLLYKIIIILSYFLRRDYIRG